MAKRKSKSRAAHSPRAALSLVHPHAAGIDIGARQHFVAVPAERDPQPVRAFDTFTADLEKLAAWLARCGITTVVMESTGIYWIPLYELLARRGFEVRLVDPRKLKQVPGRKSDVLDCQWLQQLHAFGLLSGAFRPDDDICVLRGYLRQREMLVTHAAQHIQHMQKALEQMNLKLSQVVSDICGVTGLRIIDAILAGQRDPVELAKLRDERCHASAATIAKALCGNWRAEHLLALGQAVELFRFYQRLMRQCDEHIEAHLTTLADRSAGQTLAKIAKKRGRARNEPGFDMRAALFRTTGVDLTRISGIDGHTALKVIGEIGLDMSRWPSVKHFTSWLGLCPGTKKSGGRMLSSRTKKTASRVAGALRMAAQTLMRAQTALGGYFRRLRSRLGTPKAITATAHKLARLVYSMLKYGTAYVEIGLAAYEKQHQAQRLLSLQRRANQLGFSLVPQPPLPPTPT